MAIAGDGAGMCNVSELKGIHYAMHAGMFAAEAIVERLKRGSTDDLSNYGEKVRESEIETDLYRTRNMRQPFAKGFFVGGAIANMMLISGGRFPGGRWPTHDDATVDVFVGKERDYPKPDGKRTFDKLSSVFASGNATRDDAPNHIRLQERVPLELALMWQNMCPAQVYELPEEELEAARRNGGLDGKREVKLNITPSNCVQCGAITAKGGRLTPPEGGDGPNYQLT
jgi:electron-transferring-flavoprotein dehydrogenase